MHTCIWYETSRKFYQIFNFFRIAYIHRKIEQMVQRFLIYLLSQVCITSSIINIFLQSNTFVTVDETTWYIIIPHYHITLQFTLLVFSLIQTKQLGMTERLNTAYMMCIHHYTIMQITLTVLKLRAPLIHSFLLLPSISYCWWQPLISYCFQSFPFSRMFYNGDRMICSLFKLASSIYQYTEGEEK